MSLYAHNPFLFKNRRAGMLTHFQLPVSHLFVTDSVEVLNAGRVGKTSLLARYVHNKFDDRQAATVQAVPFMARQITVGTQQVKLCLWDTAGQERFHSLGPIYYRDAQAALLVFDITDMDSFTRIKAWVTELRQIIGPKIVLAIAANKCDLEAERKVPVETIGSYAQEIGAKVFNTSAKTGLGLERVFEDIAKRILVQQHEDGARTQSLNRQASAARRRHGGITILDEPISQTPPQGSKCC